MIRAMQLSPHFTVEEFCRSTKADELGIENTPNELHLRSMQYLCAAVLEPVRLRFGAVHIRSGFRCLELNTAVGGEPTSQHTKGEASDIEIPGVRNDDLWNFIMDTLAFDQVIAEKLRLEDGAAGWVHVSYRFGNNRHEGLSFLGRDHYPPYVPGLVYV